MRNRLAQSGWMWLWVTLCVIALDHVTKMLILNHYTLHEVYAVMPSFNLTLEFNKGAAFSFLRAASGWQVFMFGGLAFVVSAVLLVWLRRLNCKEVRLCLALTLIIGGALGNLWDRMAFGYVIDFIDWYVGSLHWPVFNLADAAICLGAVLLALDAFKSKK